MRRYFQFFHYLKSRGESVHLRHTVKIMFLILLIKYESDRDRG